MLATDERPTARQSAGSAWTSLFQSVRQMAPLYLCCLFLLLLVASRSQWIPGYDTGIKQLFGNMPIAQLYLVMLIVGNTLGLILMAPLAVAVHRFVLLGEICKTPYFFNWTSLRFATLLVSFEIVQLLGVLLQIRGVSVLPTLYNIIYV